jgi:hypothetical protein
MNFPQPARILRPLRAAVFLCLASPAAASTVGVTTPAYAAPGYLIQSRNTDGIEVHGTYKYTSDFAGKIVKLNVVFSLVDPDGKGVPLNHNGNPIGGITVVDSFSDSGSSENRTLTATLKPFSPLQPGTLYRAHMQVLFATPLILTESPGRSYIHFQDVQSPESHFNAVVVAGTPVITKPWLVNTATAAAARRIEVTVPYTIHRHDPGGDVAKISLRFSPDITRPSGTPVPVSPASFSREELAVPPWNAAGTPSTVAGQIHLSLAPNEQLDSVAMLHQIRVAVENADAPDEGSIRLGNRISSAATRILHFNGKLNYGPSRATLLALANAPTAASVAGGAVQTSLNIPAGGATLDAMAGASLGDGVLRTFNLMPNGDAVYTAAAFYQVAQAAAFSGKAAGVDFQIHPGGLSLAASGARVAAGAMTVFLPGGTGYAQTAGDMLLENRLTLASPLFLDGALSPQDPVAFPIQGWVHEESKPVTTRFTSITWNPPSGSFSFLTQQCVFVRGAATDALENAASLVDNPNACRRSSNDHYYRAVSTFKGNAMSISAADDGSGKLTGTIEFGMLAIGRFHPHFPYADPHVPTTGVVATGGELRIENDLCVPAQSQLENVLFVRVEYQRACPPGDPQGCPQGLDADKEGIVFVPEKIADRHILRFTRDGGLQAAGSIAAAKSLRWGTRPGVGERAYAQQLLAEFATGSLHIAGHFLGGGIEASAQDAETKNPHFLKKPSQAAASILHSGVIPYTPATPDQMERPGVITAANGALGYSLGFGDYAGMNFRVSQQPMQARSRIGDVDSAAYALHPASKYYVRHSGVSGRHQAQTGFGEMEIYRYEMNFSHYALGYLSNSNPPGESLTRAKLQVPEPADVIFTLERMRFDCFGGIAGAHLPDGEMGATRLLGPGYWNADFQPTAFLFASNDPCGGDTYIGVHTRIFSSLLPGVPLVGVLGFDPGGQLLRPADGKGRLDSRFHIPNNASLPGALNDKRYTFTAIDHAFFNHQAASPDTEGFLCMAGHMGLPFFGKTHATIHGGAKLVPVNDFYDVMRGHISPTAEAPGRDLHHLGIPNVNGNPNGLTVTRYRDGGAGYISGSTEHMVQVRQSWLGVDMFDYKLEWNRVSRFFRSKKEGFDWFELKLKTNIEFISANKIKKKFESKAGVDFDPASLVDFAMNKVGYYLNPFEIFSPDAGQSVIAEIQNATTGVDPYLDPHPREAMADLVSQSLAKVSGTGGGPINSLANAMSEKSFGDPGELEAAIEAWEQAIDLQAQIAVDALIDHLGEVLQLQFHRYINDAIGGTDHLVDLARPGGFAASLRRWVLKDRANVDLGPFGWILGLGLESIVEVGLPGELKDMDALIKRGDGVFKVLKPRIVDPQTGVKARVDALLAAHRLRMMESAFSSMRRQLAPYHSREDRYVRMARISADDISRIVHEALRECLMASPMARDIRTLTYEWIEPSSSYYREFFRQYSTTLNLFIETYTREWAKFGAQAAAEFAGFSDDLKKIAAYGKLSGHSEYVGDSLRELHLEGEMKLALGAAAKLKGMAVFSIKERVNLNDGSRCAPAEGTKTYEVRLKVASDVMLFESIEVGAEVGLILVLDPAKGLKGFKGFGGHLLIDKKADFAAPDFSGFTLHRLAGAFMAEAGVGGYFAVMGDIDFIKFGFAGGLYAGSSCSLDPILLIDPHLKSGYGPAPYDGVYLFAMGRWLPVNLGCVARVSLGLGAGAFVFSRSAGLRLAAEASGEIKCMVKLKGRVDMVTNGLTGEGKLKLTAKVGKCPFCLKYTFLRKIVYDHNKSPSIKVK